MFVRYLLLFSVLLMVGCEQSSSKATEATTLASEQPSIEENSGQQEPGKDEEGEEENENEVPEVVVKPRSEYSLANGCYAMRPAIAEHFFQGADDHYIADAQQPEEASGFFMKPSALGEYLIYTHDKQLLTSKHTKLGVVNAPSASSARWDVDEDVLWAMEYNDGRYRVLSKKRDLALALNTDTQALEVVATQDDDVTQYVDFVAVEAEQCAEFPEIHTLAQDTTFKGNGVDKPVVGFADVHSHVSSTDFLGGVHVGVPYSPYGVTEALPDDIKTHGPDGRFDIVGNLYGGSPTDTHDTKGWPTFKDWPAHDMLTHEAAYYKWVERAWLAGMRLLVNNVVQNEVLCELQTVLKNANIVNPDNIDPRQLVGLLVNNVGDLLGASLGSHCNEMATAFRQVKFMREMEGYIDAQSGGPGEGWFRIVESPAEARRVINDGKLAVVLGIEVSHLFDCRVTNLRVLDVGVEERQCDENDIDAQLAQLYDAGIRQVNLIHEFDNALGGNGIFNELILNVGNFVDTGSFWRTEDCATEGGYEEYYFTPGTYLTSVNPLEHIPENPVTGGIEAFLGLLLKPVSELLGGPLTELPGPLGGYLSGLGDLLDTPLTKLPNELLQGTLPMYSTDNRQCNKRGLTDLGQYALNKVMDRKMIVDVDHMSLRMKEQVLVHAEARDYPLISSHGGHGGISQDQAARMLKMGGLIFPFNSTPEGFINKLQELKEILPEGEPLVMSFSSDVNGMAAQPGPSSEEYPPVQYPFTLFEGAEWNSDLFAGIEPVRFEQSAVPQGDRYFDINTEGIAHYGMYADWVESLRLSGNKEALNALYQSAEKYLQMWEKVESR